MDITHQALQESNTHPQVIGRANDDVKLCPILSKIIEHQDDVTVEQGFGPDVKMI